ncbi:MAG: hypothetical protein ABIY50_06040, partial [Ignavibacteria bacterium]
MKKIFFAIIIMAFCINASAQIKKRSTDVSVYTGIGYKFVFLTDPQARNAYPFFQLSKGDFLKELDGFFGVSFNDRYAVEFSPAYLFTNSVSSDGFYFQDNSGRRFYQPQQTRLFALPLNFRFKYFPFAEKFSSTLSKVYFGAGAGAIYINEEMTNQIYSDETRLVNLGAKTYENNFWTSNYELLLGINSFSKIGFGFELSYRFVPLNQPQN